MPLHHRNVLTCQSDPPCRSNTRFIQGLQCLGHALSAYLSQDRIGETNQSTWLPSYTSLRIYIYFVFLKSWVRNQTTQHTFKLLCISADIYILVLYFSLVCHIALLPCVGAHFSLLLYFWHLSLFNVASASISCSCFSGQVNCRGY